MSILLTKTKSKASIAIVSVVIIAAILAGMMCALFAPTHAFAEENVHTYVETTDEIVNPAAGFYKAFTVKLTRGSNYEPVSEYTINYYSQDFGLYHILFDIADFSANAGGADAEIDASALSVADKLFGYLRKCKKGAIVRFDYNRAGTQVGGKYVEAEPSLDLVLKHIENVSTVISKYSDVILGIESGMLGPWGEQHSTTLASSGANTYYRLVQTWLDNTPNTMGITVRRPLYFSYWANVKFSLNMSVSDLANFDVSSYSQAERVGMYNDGYLGSSSDLGTFTDRAPETAFIGKQAERTYYGGELVADSQTGLLGEYNSVSYLETEGFVTHTSYLNIDWNYNVFNEYKKRTYNGADELYKGKTSEFTFVKNRLGYRFYLSQSKDAVIDAQNKVSLSFTIANAGFSRILCPTRSKLVFTDGTNTSDPIDCDVDLSQIPSAKSVSEAGTKEFELSIDVPAQFANGNCSVYLRFCTEYGAEILLANDESVCAPNRQGVKIASVKESDPVTLSGISVTTQPTKTAYKVGETINLTGLTVTATYSNGATVPIAVTPNILSGFDSATVGTKTVTVTYEGKTATFEVSVEAATGSNQSEPDPAKSSQLLKTSDIIVICVAAVIVVACLVPVFVILYRKKKS